jgi:hypothetical protein
MDETVTSPAASSSASLLSDCTNSAAASLDDEPEFTSTAGAAKSE